MNVSHYFSLRLLLSFCLSQYLSLSIHLSPLPNFMAKPPCYQLSVYVMVLLRMDTQGVPGFQVTDTKARFEQPMAVETDVVLGGSLTSSFATTIRARRVADRHNNITFAGARSLSLQYFGTSLGTKSHLQLHSRNAAVRSNVSWLTRSMSAFSRQPSGGQSAAAVTDDGTEYWTVSPASMELHALKLHINSKKLQASVVRADRFVAPLNDSLNIDSPADIRIMAFRDVSMRSRSRQLTLQASKGGWQIFNP